MTGASHRISRIALLAVLAGQGVWAQERPETNFNGAPGLIEMPSGFADPEGTLGATVAYNEGLTRATLSVQPHERVGASFRILRADVWDGTLSETEDAEASRSFDLRFQLTEEGPVMPAISLGLQDILSPARLGGEYVVASKSFGETLAVTAGVGWGVLGQRDGFAGDPADRPATTADPLGGTLASDSWFRGEAALFGGASWRFSDRWSVAAEYSSTTYPVEEGAPAITVDSPVNYGLTWHPRANAQVQLAYLYGNTFGIAGHFALNANDRPGQGGRETAPAPIQPRAAAPAGPLPEAALASALGTLLEIEGIRLTGLDVDGDRATVRYENGRYRSEAQAMGRVARMMTQVMPQNVTRFTLQPEARGIALSAVTLPRAELERYETRPGASAALYAAADFSDAAGSTPATIPDDDPAFAWGIAPYGRFLPESAEGETGIDVGLTLTGVYELTPSLIARGEIGQSLLRNDALDPPADPTPDLQNVRSDGYYYGDDGHPVLRALTLTHYSRPAANLYGRVSGGYLEPMFAGVAGELLWKPVDSRLGVGLEIAQVAQRDSDMLFGIEEYDYRTTTGHLSAYYDLGGGYHTQLDVGRYLAGDWGATLHLDREWANGVRVGAYVTRTEATAEDFGDGSYSKGISVTIPRDFLFGRPSRSDFGTEFDAATGDGGARLEIDGRLYDVVRSGHSADLGKTWGRFWR